MATAHYLQAGTERTNPIVLLSVEAVTAVVLYLTLLRVLAHRKARRRGAARPAPKAASAARVRTTATTVAVPGAGATAPAPAMGPVEPVEDGQPTPVPVWSGGSLSG
jgi:hypothetical protein